MPRFIIRGGKRLCGRHRAPGNKNAVLPMLAASVLTDEPVALSRVPLIEDVYTMLAILEDLGVDVRLRGHTVTLQARRLRRRRLNAGLCRRARASILFAGPMLARHGAVTLYPPGGDIIGRRRIDTHFAAFRALGVDFSGGTSFQFKGRPAAGADVLLDEASVTATENSVMATVLSPGRTTLFNAACEPHVQDLCRMLTRMGARIEGIGTNRLVIDGVPALHGVRHRVSPDIIDSAGFLAAAALTGGRIEVADVPASDFTVIERTFARLGIVCARDGHTVCVDGAEPPRVCNDYGAAIPAIEDGPWPMFPSDLMSVMIVLATRAQGTVLFFEKMFESRMVFVDRLIEMGARIVRCDPHRVIVTGPSTLRGMRLASPDIRAGIALVLAALCADGQSVIENVQVIDRGYEQVERELRRLGADIIRKKV
ncbi:MAG: UDP-N-acetylglucosamine 1-carboxyvinyltransferase [Lentisphaerae bacterium]|nr:UDP-N-acetylglucosamine 1-carboxyvinyltransferase [Lentisphaerota bacterium]